MSSLILIFFPPKDWNQRFFDSEFLMNWWNRQLFKNQITAQTLGIEAGVCGTRPQTVQVGETAAYMLKAKHEHSRVLGYIIVIFFVNFVM
jgi:hypothetical protein